MAVREQGHVVMTVPSDVAQLPGAGESTQAVGSFDQRYGLSLLGETKGQCHAEHATAYDSPPTTHR